jgi:carbamoyltransferase
MKILAVHLFTHDTSATYFDGENTYYCKFERPTQIKRYNFFKHQAHYAKDYLKGMNIDWENLDVFTFTAGELENERELDKKINWQLNEGEFIGEVTQDLVDLMFPNLYIRAKKYYRVDHHYAHYMSGDFLYRDTMGGFILDGNGDYQVHRSVFKGLQKTDKSDIKDGMSIGHLFEVVSDDFLRPEPLDAFNSNSSIDCAGKLMGLMSYGQYNEDYANFLRKFDLNMLPAIAQSDFIYSRFIYKDREDSPYPEGFFNDDKLWRRVDGVKGKFWWHVDWIHTWQEVVIEKVVEYAKQHFNKDDKFVFSGGVAHNVVMNAALNEEFPNMVIPPCVGDEGLSLGSMWAVCRKYDIEIPFPDGQFSDETIEYPSDDTLSAVAEKLATGKVVATVMGPGEIGPRALGHRSILYAPFIGIATKYFHSRGIKKREWWRPYGIIILEEDLEQYLNTRTKSPYMLHVATPTELGKEKLSGVIHADNTVRYQTVSSGPVYELLRKFKSMTGCSAIVNTSCNSPGKPIVHTKSNAIEFAEVSQPDYLMLGDELLEIVQHA